MEVVHIHYPLTQQMLPAAQPAAIALGFFDGIHLGHQQLLKRARGMASRLNIAPGIMTFDPHPREVLGNRGPFYYVTPLEEKLRQMAQYGMEIVYIAHFDRPFSEVTPGQFVDDVLIPLKVKGVVVGYNYTFGHKASGKAEDLKQLSKGQLQVDIVQPVDVQGMRVSSTRLRQALQQGEVQTATTLLGRPYRIHGVVEHGAGRGKELGFPTANLRLDDTYILPRTGVYAVRVEHEGEHYYGALSIGYNPTFEDAPKAVSVEVYVLDFSGELYGDTLYISFLRFLRPEVKFDTVDELIKQMEEDVRQTRQIANEEQVVD